MLIKNVSIQFQLCVSCVIISCTNICCKLTKDPLLACCVCHYPSYSVIAVWKCSCFNILLLCAVMFSLKQVLLYILVRWLSRNAAVTATTLWNIVYRVHLQIVWDWQWHVTTLSVYRRAWLNVYIHVSVYWCAMCFFTDYCDVSASVRMWAQPAAGAVFMVSSSPYLQQLGQLSVVGIVNRLLWNSSCLLINTLNTLVSRCWSHWTTVVNRPPDSDFWNWIFKFKKFEICEFATWGNVCVCPLARQWNIGRAQSLCHGQFPV